MLKRALGYEYTETTREYIPELDEIEKLTKKVNKASSAGHYSPDLLVEEPETGQVER